MSIYYSENISARTSLPASGISDPAFLLDISYSGVEKKISLADFRTLGMKAVSVRQYGAVGDGTTDDTTAIQAAVNWHASLSASQKRGVTISLDGGQYTVSQINISSDNNGLTFGYGYLVRKSGSGPGPNGVVSVVQSSGSSTPLEDITITNLEISGYGQYSVVSDHSADNTANLLNYQYCNGVEVYSNQLTMANRGVKRITVQNIKCYRLGKSAIIFDEPENCTIKNIYANRCVQHTVGVSAISDYLTWPSGRTLSVDVDNIIGENTTTLIDLSQITDAVNTQKYLGYANLSNFYGRDISGRSKVVGVWGVNINNYSVDNRGLGYKDWAALDFAAKDYTYINISNFYARNCIAAIKGDAAGTQFECGANITNLTAISCIYGVVLSAKHLNIKNMYLNDVYGPSQLSLCDTVIIDGFYFKNINRENFAALSIPPYSMVNTPVKLFVLKNGTIETLGNPALAYNDYFLYIGSGSAHVSFQNVRVHTPHTNKYYALVRNDSQTAILNFENVNTESGMFLTYSVWNNTVSGECYIKNCILSQATSDPYAGSLSKFGETNYMWIDASGIMRVKTSKPTSRTDGTVIGTQT